MTVGGRRHGEQNMALAARRGGIIHPLPGECRTLARHDTLYRCRTGLAGAYVQDEVATHCENLKRKKERVF
jgi:hypothetical protein